MADTDVSHENISLRAAVNEWVEKERRAQAKIVDLVEETHRLKRELRGIHNFLTILCADPAILHMPKHIIEAIKSERELVGEKLEAKDAET